MTTDVTAAAAPPASGGSRLAGTWNTVKRLYVFLLPIRFSLLALALVGFAFIVSAQGHDIIAAMAEDDPTPTGGSHLWQRILFVPLVTFLALQVWYWSRTLLRICAPGAPSAAEFPRLASFIPRALGVAAYLIMLAALRRVGMEYGQGGETPLTSLKILAGWLVVSMLLFILFCVLRRRWLDERGSTVAAQKDLQQLAPSTRRILRVLLGLAVVFFLASCFFVQETGRLGSIAIVLLSLALWVSFGSVLVYAGMRARMPILTILMGVALLSSPLADNHVVPTLAGTAGLVAARPTVAQAFDRWSARLAHDYPAEANHPVFVVATEGGGIRAAYWTAAVLTALDDDIPGFRQHLFAVSGVSGGSVGAAAYAALITRQMDAPDQLPKLRPTAKRMLAHDALAPTLSAMTQQDFVQRFIAYPFLPDRARALEGGWQRAWRLENGGDDRLAKGFLAMLAGREDRMPSFFLNGTTVETGQRMIGSNCRIAAPELADALDDFDAAGLDLPVTTTALNSARFTYVSPAGTFLRNRAGYPASPYKCAPGKRCEHVVDGGYLDNSGAITAAEIVDVVRNRAREDHLAVTPYVLILQYVAASQAPGTPPGTPKEKASEVPSAAAAACVAGPPSVATERWGNEVLSPVRALLNTRGARAVLAVSQLRAQLRNAQGPDAIPFTLCQYPNTVPMPLGWLLSFYTRSAIDSQVGSGENENAPAMAEIAKLLGTTVLPDATQQEAVAVPAVRRMRLWHRRH
jgi:hypothetical protein